MNNMIREKFEDSLRNFNGFIDGKIDLEEAVEYIAIKHFKDLVAYHDRLRDSLVTLGVYAVTETGELDISEILDDAIFTVNHFYLEDIKKIVGELEAEWLEQNRFLKRYYNPNNILRGANDERLCI